MERFKDIPMEKYREILENKTKDELIEIAFNAIEREKKSISGESVTDKILKKVRKESPLERVNDKCNLAVVNNRRELLKSFAEEWNKNGFNLISDCHIDDFLKRF